MAACSNNIKGLFAGAASSDVIDHVTIATTGNATDFGNLSLARGSVGATANDSRGVFAGGMASSYSNTIDYVTIATPGNATDFGDLTVAREYLAGLSGT